MPRNRIIYQSEGLFVGPTGSISGVSLSGIQRVQSVSHSKTINRQDVNQFGKLARIDSIILTPPAVTLDFTANLVDAVNANRIGLVCDGSVSCISNILSGVTDIKNYYIAIGNDGQDIAGSTGNGAISFGNSFLTNATYQGAVGQLATEAYTVEALNTCTHVISSGEVPTVNPTNGQKVTGVYFAIPVGSTGSALSVAALQPGDITVTLQNTLGFSTTDLHVQNFNLTVPLAREDINQLGTKFAFAKVLTFPITVTATFSAIAGDLANSCLSDVLCSDPFVQLDVNLRQPNCSGTGNVAIRFTMKGAKLDSSNYSSDIGSNATVDFAYSTQLGSALDSTIGLFISGNVL